MKNRRKEECGYGCAVEFEILPLVSTCSLVSVGQQSNRICVVAKMNGTVWDQQGMKKNDKQMSAGQNNIEFVLRCPETIHS